MVSFFNSTNVKTVCHFFTVQTTNFSDLYNLFFLFSRKFYCVLNVNNCLNLERSMKNTQAYIKSIHVFVELRLPVARQVGKDVIVSDCVTQLLVQPVGHWVSAGLC